MAQPFAATAAPPAGWAALQDAGQASIYPPGAPAEVAAAMAGPGVPPQASCPAAGCYLPPPQQPTPLYPAIYAPPAEQQQQQWGCGNGKVLQQPLLPLLLPLAMATHTHQCSPLP